MKKFIAIMIGLFLTLGFVGCNPDGSDIDIDLDEFISAPTNLSVDGETLSWDAVDDAKGYIVYADGEEVDKVDETSFDFSDLDGDRIIFQVQTEAPRGYQDSALSISIAYVANMEVEVAAVSAVLDDTTMDLPEDFAVELVSKGMLDEDVEDMMNSYGEMVSLMAASQDFEDILGAIRHLVENEEENLEALVSAIVKEMLPMVLQEQIDMYEEQIDYYEDGGMYYETMISSLEQQIEMYEGLLEEIEDNPDPIILAITTTIEYFISVEEMISENLVDLIVDLSESDGPEDLNASELNQIKEEIVSVLRETMPSEEDMVLVMEVFDLLASLSGTTIDYTGEVENYNGKMAAQSLYSLEAFINFLDTFDEDYFEVVVAQMQSDDYYGLVQAEILIETVVYFDSFLDDNEDLLDTINEVFTEEEQEALFTGAIEAMDDVEGMESYAEAYASLDFQQLMNLQLIFEDSFEAVLDEFIATDGEIVRAVALYNAFTYYPDYSNEATGETYDDYSEFYTARNLASIDVSIEVVKLLNAYVQSIDKDDMGDLVDFISESLLEASIASLEATLEMYGEEMPFTDSEIQDAKDALVAGLDAANEDLLELVQNLFEYLVDEEVLAEYKTVMADMDERSEGYETIVFIAQHYDAFMTNSNSGLLDDIIVVVFDTLSDEDLQAITEMTAEDVTLIETTVNGFLELLEEQFAIIADMDADDLSEADMAVIQSFIESLMMISYGQEEMY